MTSSADGADRQDVAELTTLGEGKHSGPNPPLMGTRLFDISTGTFRARGSNRKPSVAVNSLPKVSSP